MNKEWRPDDWVGIKKKICFDQFHKGLAPKCKSCSSTPDKCQKDVESGASAMLAALDKWWVEWIDKLIIGCDGGRGPDYRPIILDISIETWQQFKLSLQSSAALTTLMGKFPDLPDEEAKQ